MDWRRDVRDVPICVDGRMLGTGGTGVSTYARSLAQAIGDVTDHHIRLVAGNTNDSRWAKWSDALRSVPRPLRPAADDRGRVLVGRDIFRRAHVHFGIRRKLYPLRCDLTPGIMHWTYPVPMVMDGWINLYTIHDTIPLDHPDLTPIDPRRYRAVLDAIVERGDGITTVSQSARTAIVQALRCDPDFVVDTRQPVYVAQPPSGRLPVGLVRHGYFLVVGSIEPRKNVAAILAAFRQAHTELALVLVGPDGWHADPILADIAATPGAIRIAYADRDDLLALVSNARALIFPSLAEGFGLPMVEAMTLGTPVLTSDTGALAEIAGDAALTVDPTSVAAIRDGLVRLARDDALTAALTARGTVRAAKFSPARFAARLTEVYTTALRAQDAAATGARFPVRRA